MKKSYEALSADVVKFEAQDVITASGSPDDSAGGAPNDPPKEQDPQL